MQGCDVKMKIWLISAQVANWCKRNISSLGQINGALIDCIFIIMSVTADVRSGGAYRVGTASRLPTPSAGVLVRHGTHTSRLSALTSFLACTLLAGGNRAKIHAYIIALY